MWIEEIEAKDKKTGKEIIKYKYVERYTDPLTGKQRKTSITHTKKNTRVEKEMFMKLQEKIEEKTQNSSTDITFEELSKKYMKVYKETVRSSTYEVDSGRLNTINRAVGETRLSHTKPALFNQFLLDEFEKGYSYDTVNSKKKLIKRILSFGIEFGYLSDVTLPEKVIIKKLNVPEKDEWKYLEREELQAVVKYFETNDMHERARLAKFQAATGMRFGEVISLDYKRHIDFSKNEILIERSYDKSNKIFTLPKNDKTRTIYVKDSTMDIIKEQIRYDQLKMMKYKLDRKNTLLFRTPYDNPYNIKSMNNKLKKINLESGKKLTTHIFRHTFITMMVEAGIDANLIAEHVGHSDTKMIEKVYSHFTDTMNKRLKQAVLNVDII